MTLLTINGVMFVAEVVVGWIAESTALLADSLDMLADAIVSLEYYLETLQALMPEVTETAPSEANDGGSDGADGADRPDDKQGEQAGPELEFDLFRIDIAEAVSTRIGDPADHLVLTVWHETRGTQTIRRT